MSSKNFKKTCAYCSGNHANEGKCAQYGRDHSIALSISCTNVSSDDKLQTNLNNVPKNILRLTVGIHEMGKVYRGHILYPRVQRSKPLSKFTKKQLIDRIIQTSKDFDEQADTIVAREKKEHTEREQAEENVCPICLDTLSNQAQCTSPCGHTFCSSCFITHLSTELSRRNTVKCPCCRTTTAEITNRW